MSDDWVELVSGRGRMTIITNYDRYNWHKAIRRTRRNRDDVCQTMGSAGPTNGIGGGSGTDTREEDDPMLVLNRKRGEGVMIGENIEVTVLEVHGDRVKLGFRSPADVSIHREEIYQQDPSPAGGKHEAVA